MPKVKVRFNKICLYCNRGYNVIKSRLLRTKYCSRHCHNTAIAGKGASKGKGITRNKGAKHPYLSEWNRTHVRYGKDNYAWKGGITPKNYIIRKSLPMIEFKKNCLVRDNYTCQLCGKIGGDLEIHHIKRFSDFPLLRTDTSNGITLCLICHNKTKQKEEQFEDLFFKIINMK